MTLTPTIEVNASAASLEGFATWSDEHPIVMVNFLRYAGDEGREAYGRYGQVAAQSIAAVGGSLVYLAPVIDSPDSWESVALVHYPRPSAYLEMQKDPNYSAAIPDRTAGLAARLLYPFALVDITAQEAADSAQADLQQVLAVELIRRNESERSDAMSAVAGELVFRLAANGPGLVADDRWDELQVVRYRSVEHWQEGEQVRSAAEDGAQDVMSVLAGNRSEES